MHQVVVGYGTSHHGFTDWHGSDADAWVVTAFGHHIDFFTFGCNAFGFG